MEIVIQYESVKVPVPGPDGPIMHDGVKYLVSFVSPSGKTEALCNPVAVNFLEFIARLKRIGRLIENDNSVRPIDLVLGSPSKNGKDKSGKFTISTLGSEQSDLTAAAWVLLNKLSSEVHKSIQEVAQEILAAESEGQVGK